MMKNAAIEKDLDNWFSFYNENQGYLIKKIHKNICSEALGFATSAKNSDEFKKFFSLTMIVEGWKTWDIRNNDNFRILALSVATTVCLVPWNKFFAEKWK